MAEARKYKLDLIIAHQYIKQLEDNIREAVFGNVGSLAAFRVGTTDTEVLLKQFAPEFSEKDLISVENQHAFAKLLVNGERPGRSLSRPFGLSRVLPKSEKSSKNFRG